jgi:hypothetical protein
MALNLITRSEYKTYAGIKSTNSDAEIDALIPKVSEFVKNYCRRTFVDYMDTPKTEIFDGGVPFLILQETPVVNIVSLEYSTDYGQTYTALTKFTDWINRDYAVMPIPSGKLGNTFPNLLAGYKVNYYAGYDDVPTDLSLAVMDLVTYYRKNDGSVHNQKSPGGGGSVQVEYIVNTTLPAHIRRVLDLYVADYT